ncbi:MAG: haloalkane dehalogenase [Acidimicrobiia bacterium]|nr:MAG: haloalkane dehalogenase [Acidimicrobiia bacterium]
MSWEALRTPEERFAHIEGFPFEPHYHEIDGLRIHYLDEGAGPPIVLFHGEPTWSYLYRKMIPPLVDAGYRIIAPDYPGFGRSDKPTDPDFYTYDRHVAFMAELIEWLDLTETTAVVQDWGGPIGLRLAVEHPARFNRLVILNTALFSGQAPVGPAFMKWISFVEKTPDLPVGFIMARSAVSEWPEEVLAAYEAPFPDARYKVGAHRFPLIVPLDPEQPGAADMLAVRTALESWAGPATVIFSTEDPVFPPAVGERWVERLPTAGALTLIEGAGHFLQEERGEAVATAMISFLDG